MGEDRKLNELVRISGLWRRAIVCGGTWDDADADAAPARMPNEGAADGSHDAAPAACKQIHTKFGQEFANGPRVVLVLVGAGTDHANRVKRESGCHRSVARTGNPVIGKVDPPCLPPLRPFNPGLER